MRGGGPAGGDEAPPWTAAGERYFAAALVLAVLLFLGNLAPKLPFSRHTGLRLPWTVADEDTWTVATGWWGTSPFPWPWSTWRVSP